MVVEHPETERRREYQSRLRGDLEFVASHLTALHARSGCPGAVRAVHVDVDDLALLVAECGCAPVLLALASTSLELLGHKLGSLGTELEWPGPVSLQ